MNRLINSIKENKFILIMAIYFTIFYIVQNINGRFWLHDFEVYYTASKHFITGQQVYNQPFGLPTGNYKYSPFALFFFIPFTLFSFSWAKTIYFSIVSVVTIYLIISLGSFTEIHFFNNKILAKNNKILFLSILISLVHIYRELHLGNINIILLTTLILCLSMMIRNREYTAGFIIGLVVLFKPHFLALLPLLLLRKRIRTITAIVASIILGIGLPIFITGTQKGINLHKSWTNIMVEHNSSSFLVNSVNTIHSWLYKIGVKYLFSEPTVLYSYIVIFIIACLILYFVIQNQTKEKNTYTGIECDKFITMDFIFEYIFIIAIISSITITDTEHFLLSLPLIMFLLFFIIYENGKRNPFFYFVVITFALYGGNWHDLLGSKLSSWVAASGLLGLANIFILIASLYAFNKMKSKRI